MKILITGASGLVGSHLMIAFLRKNYEVIVHTRNPKSFREKFNYPVEIVSTLDPELFTDIDAVVALSGENVGQGRWTEQKKERILRSRLEGISQIKYAMSCAKKFPKIFISASAIGIYDQNGFLKKVCEEWEQAIFDVYSFMQDSSQTRVVAMRTGVVLSNSDGALAKMRIPIALGIGGPIGSGQQYVSWIHIEDLCNMYVYCVENDTVQGPIDAVSPHPVTNKELTKALGVLMKRPTFFYTPSFIIRLALGEMADLVINSCHITPEKIQNLGFSFLYPRLMEALKHLGVGEQKNFLQYQFVPTQLHEIFDFYSNPYNLEKMTPPMLSFKLVDMSDKTMATGVKIKYKLKVYGITFFWISSIDQWEKNNRFIDVQTKGPFKSWHHTHAFHVYKSKKFDGVFIEDNIKYSLPFSLLSDFINCFVHKDLVKIFEFRKKIIQKNYNDTFLNS